MNDREEPEVISETEIEHQQEAVADSPTPILDMDVFVQLRDVVRSNYLWRWEESAKPTQTMIKDLTNRIAHDSQFHLVGDIEIEDHTFEITLWLEDSLAFTLATVDVMMLDAMQIDFSRCMIMARELTKNGLEYHLVIFGEGQAQQLQINVIGPRMQQIRDLGTLVAQSQESFSA